MTRRGYVAGALVALVLLVVPLGLVPYVLAPLNADREPPARRERPTLDAAGDRSTADAITCDAEAAPPASLPLSGSLQGARLCATTPRYRAWTAPEPLFESLDVLAAGLGRLEPPEKGTFCAQSGSYHYDLRLVVDGEVVSLRTQPSCLEFSVGGVDYWNTDEPFDAYLTALAQQRSRRDPPPLAPTTALDCTATPRGQDHRLSPLGDPRDMVEAVSCWRPDSKDDVGPWRGGAPVAPRDLAVLMGDIPDHTRQDLGFDTGPCGNERYVWQDILGRTSWGDVVVIRGVCDTYLLSDGDDVVPEDQDFWYPSPPAQRILDRLRR